MKCTHCNYEFKFGEMAGCVISGVNCNIYLCPACGKKIQSNIDTNIPTNAGYSSINECTKKKNKCDAAGFEHAWKSTEGITSVLNREKCLNCGLIREHRYIWIYQDETGHKFVKEDEL